MCGNLFGADRYWAVHTQDRFGDKRELIGAMPGWNQVQFTRQEIEGFSRVRSEEERAKSPPQGDAG
jgi:hypothetical protein